MDAGAARFGSNRTGGAQNSGLKARWAAVRERPGSAECPCSTCLIMKVPCIEARPALHLSVSAAVSSVCLGAELRVWHFRRIQFDLSLIAFVTVLPCGGFGARHPRAPRPMRRPLPSKPATPSADAALPSDPALSPAPGCHGCPEREDSFCLPSGKNGNGRALGLAVGFCHPTHHAARGRVEDQACATDSARRLGELVSPRKPTNTRCGSQVGEHHRTGRSSSGSALGHERIVWNTGHRRRADLEVLPRATPGASLRLRTPAERKEAGTW